MPAWALEASAYWQAHLAICSTQQRWKGTGRSPVLGRAPEHQVAPWPVPASTVTT